MTEKQAAQKLGKDLDDLGDTKSQAEFWQKVRAKGYPARVSARSNWGIQEGWNYNPGIHTESGDLSVWKHVNNPEKCPPQLKNRFLKHLHENSAKIYGHSLDLWVDRIYDGENTLGKRQRVIGWASAALGGKPIVASYSNVQHAIGDRKDRSEKGNTDQRITKEWAKKIPQILAKPDSVYWDQKEKSFLYYKSTGDGKEIKVVLKKGLVGGKSVENYLKLETCDKQEKNTGQKSIWLLGEKRANNN